jgi:Family of unknown function (DUF6510)
MAFISRGFKGKRRDVADSSRVPPGQHVVHDFPVLSAGPTPRLPLAEWSFSIVGELLDRFAARGFSVGRVDVYLNAPGAVVRCPACEQVLMRIVHNRGRYWIDLTGIRCLELGPTD